MRGCTCPVTELELSELLHNDESQAGSVRVALQFDRLLRRKLLLPHIFASQALVLANCIHSKWLVCVPADEAVGRDAAVLQPPGLCSYSRREAGF